MKKKPARCTVCGEPGRKDWHAHHYKKIGLQPIVVEKEDYDLILTDAHYCLIPRQ